MVVVVPTFTVSQDCCPPEVAGAVFCPKVRLSGESQLINQVLCQSNTALKKILYYKKTNHLNHIAVTLGESGEARSSDSTIGRMGRELGQAIFDKSPSKNP